MFSLTIGSSQSVCICVPLNLLESVLSSALKSLIGDHHEDNVEFTRNADYVFKIPVFCVRPSQSLWHPSGLHLSSTKTVFFSLCMLLNLDYFVQKVLNV